MRNRQRVGVGSLNTLTRSLVARKGFSLCGLLVREWGEMRNVYYHKETFGKKHYVEEPRGEWRFSHGEVSSSGGRGGD